MPTEPVYDAVLLMSFGGPEGREDVLPFLENVLRGKNVPEARKLEVAEHYYHFGSVSPINAQNRALIAALEKELRCHGIHLPIYWGNRNWHPFITDTLHQMRDDGIRRALTIFTSAYSCYSGCRQYREDIQRARETVGPDAPEVHKIRHFFNHPGFIRANVENVRAALQAFPEDERADVYFLFTAHSIPMAMANGCNYVKQLMDAAGTVAEGVGAKLWKLVYQSRSGPPSQPWLEPDVGDMLRELKAQGITNVLISPIGFVSDHMEVLFDLDTEARELCEHLGIRMSRAATAGTHAAFIAGLRELIEERLFNKPERPFVGKLHAWHDTCPADCCPSGRPAAMPRPGPHGPPLHRA